MTSFCATINNTLEKGQSYLELHIPEMPKDAVKGIMRSSTCSFSVSIILSGGNPVAAITAGALAILATAIHVAFIAGTEKLFNYLSALSNKPKDKEPISFEGRHCAFLLGFGGVLYLGLANNAASFLLTIPCILLNPFRNKEQTPMMGIVVF